MPLFKLRVSASDLAAGRAAADAIGELAAPQALAVTLFEAMPPAFIVEAYYDARPGRRRFARALARGCGTGILAIAAARALPGARILAADNDPVATAVAR